MSELIRREDAIKATWQEPSYTDPYNVLTEVRDRIQALPAASPWHRVEEELPKVGTNCLVGWKLNDGFCYEDSVYGYGTNGLGFWVRREEHDQVVDPDYWMPIEPPKEDA